MNIRIPSPLAALLVCCAACNPFDPSDPEADPLSVPLSEIIDLQHTYPYALPVDSVTVDTLIAYLPRGASTRLVKFTTTAGRFQESNAKAIEVVAVPTTGKRLRAITLLLADTSASSATIAARVDIFTDYLEVAFAPIR